MTRRAPLVAAANSGTGAVGSAGVLPWLIPGAAALAAAAAGALWVGGGAASLLAGHGWRSAPLSVEQLLRLAAQPQHSARLWPQVDPAAVAACSVAVLLAVVVPLVVLAARACLRALPAHDPRWSLARPRDLSALLRPRVDQRALQLRPSLRPPAGAGRATGRGRVGIAPGEVGLRLGTLQGRDVFCSWEDVAVALMAPRSGKTTSLAVPAVLSAPGPVVLTSNKSEGWKETAVLRAGDTGETVWTFDPQQITYTPQTWWWNPLATVRTVEQASRLAGHFISTVEDDRRDIWGPAARELLSTLLLAAASSDRSLHDVYLWLTDEASPEPGGLLRENGYDLLARALRGMQDSPEETRGSVYFTARAATACLRDDRITAWVTPPVSSAAGANARSGWAEFDEGDDGWGLALGIVRDELVEFRPEQFVQSRQTLYLLSKDEGGSAGPLVAALTDAVLRAGIGQAERAGGRLDPPLVLVLDEAANICRIADLPALYSHLGSRGIVPLTILQSYSQAVSAWGQNGSKALWGAATIKLIGPGTDDPAFAEDLSRLVGDHDITTVSHSSGRGSGGTSRSTSTRQQRILPPSAIRALPRGQALLLATGLPAALIELQPWFTGPRADAIRAADATALSGIAERARTSQTRLTTDHRDVSPLARHQERAHEP